jgi:hypothetical protein
MPSFGRELKPFVPCPRFAACHRTLYLTVEIATYRLNFSEDLDIDGKLRLNLDLKVSVRARVVLLCERR